MGSGSKEKWPRTSWRGQWSSRRRAGPVRTRLDAGTHQSGGGGRAAPGETGRPAPGHQRGKTDGDPDCSRRGREQSGDLSDFRGETDDAVRCAAACRPAAPATRRWRAVTASCTTDQPPAGENVRIIRLRHPQNPAPWPSPGIALVVCLPESCNVPMAHGVHQRLPNQGDLAAFVARAFWGQWPC
jgi:hypothetical protein